MTYAYYPGCSAKSTCSELNVSTKLLAKKLGLELLELESATCTGSREIRAVDPDLFLALNGRILALAEQAGRPLMTVCNTCLLNLLETNKRLHDDPKAMDRVNGMVAAEGLQYRGTTRVTHLLWVLLEDVGPERLRRLVIRPLRGLKVAVFYGCHIVRPETLHGLEDSRDVRSFERLNEILGCDSMEYSGRTACCGFHTAAAEESVAIKLTGRHIKSAKDGGAHAVVTPCPLCHTILDTLQPEMETDLRTPLGVSVLHLSQLVGLAIGLSPAELEISRHAVPVRLPV